ncbi:MAG TPA: response regulator transcription factor [Thermomicrobiaceae bacterium]|nr:response regulator transcription factor [Thermomicrobiaceae bacterium]
MIRVMLVDDHPRMRKALRSIVEVDPGITVVAEAADGQTAVARALAARPDVILMDIALPDQSGIEAARELGACLPSTRVVMVTVSSSDRHLLESLQAGAVGYITKDASREEIRAAVRAGHAGSLPFTSAMAARVLAHFRGLGPVEHEGAAERLSQREHEVLSLVARGCSNKEIGSLLGISAGTAKKHVENILGKLQVRTRAEATRWLSATGTRREPAERLDAGIGP